MDSMGCCFGDFRKHRFEFDYGIGGRATALGSRNDRDVDSFTLDRLVIAGHDREPPTEAEHR
jgi:hypothetical protein